MGINRKFSPGGHYAQWNKLVPEGEIAQNSTSVRLSKTVKLTEAENTGMVGDGETGS